MKILIIILLLLITTSCFSDELQLPFSVYPKKLQAKFIEKGYKLDLSANDREEDSWGFIVSEGTKFSIFTYHPVTQKEMQDIIKIMGEEDVKDERF